MTDSIEDETLQQAIDRLHAEVEAFKRRYLSGHAENPEYWPLSMPPGEWDEQFRLDEGQ